jgi:hypothetical protein
MPLNPNEYLTFKNIFFLTILLFVLYISFYKKRENMNDTYRLNTIKDNLEKITNKISKQFKINIIDINLVFKNGFEYSQYYTYDANNKDTNYNFGEVDHKNYIDLQFNPNSNSNSESDLNLMVDYRNNEPLHYYINYRNSVDKLDITYEINSIIKTINTHNNFIKSNKL